MSMMLTLLNKANTAMASLSETISEVRSQFQEPFLAGASTSETPGPATPDSGAKPKPGKGRGKERQYRI